MPEYSVARKAAAWGVHAFTASGLAFAYLMMVGLQQKNIRYVFLGIWMATIVDAVDGTMARKVDVKKVLPGFDGGLLDNIIDYITFAFIPALAMPVFGLLPAGFEWVAVLPMLASGYQFCQSNAKTPDSFVGFPSYWNILLIYLYVLEANPWFSLASLVVLSILVFVPIHYLYPSKAKTLKWPTMIGGFAWAFLLVPVMLFPDADWAYPVTAASFVYPVYYLVASLYHHSLVVARAPAVQEP
jgi:phosphatidylcholine synthase